MISEDAIDALQTTLQAAYVAAGSAVIVVSTWPDPNDFDPGAEWIVLHEGSETDVLLGNGMRGNPSPPAMQSDPDIVLLDYFQQSISQQDPTFGATMATAQQKMRAAKNLLMGVFTAGSAALTLGGAVLNAGLIIRVHHPRTGPYDPNDTSGNVRFTFAASINMRCHNH